MTGGSSSRDRWKIRMVAFGLMFQDGRLVVQGKGRNKSCHLPCRNNSTCRLTQPTFSSSTTTVPHHQANSPLTKKSLIAVQRPYCYCPTEYTGPYCEIKYVLCPDGNQSIGNSTCANEQPCRRDIDHNNVPFYHCGCDINGTDFDASPYAAPFCQHSSTIFCGANVDYKSLGRAGSSYCTNGGICNNDIDESNNETANSKPVQNHHVGCTCPANWTGQHCEISRNGDNSVMQPHISWYGVETTHSPNHIIRFVIASICLVILCALGIATAYLVHHGYQQQKRRKRGKKHRRGKEQQRKQKLKEQEMVPQSYARHEIDSEGHNYDEAEEEQEQEDDALQPDPDDIEEETG